MQPVFDVIQAAPLKCSEIVHYWWVPPVGWSVAILAVIAFIYAVIAEEYRRPWLHRFAVLMIVLLGGLELEAINSDRTEHDRTVCEQTNQFQSIALQLTKDMKANKAHFDKTMDSEDHLLKGIKDVGSISQTTLKNISGGESFGYLEPFSTGPGPFTNLILYNGGSEDLIGLTLIVEGVTNDCPLPSTETCHQIWDGGASSPISIGALGPHELFSVTTRLIPFLNRPNQTGHYLFRIFAQNGQVMEDMEFRQSLSHSGYSYRFKVFRQVSKPKEADFQMGVIGHYKILKSKDWTEYSPEQSLDGIHPISQP